MPDDLPDDLESRTTAAFVAAAVAPTPSNTARAVAMVRWLDVDRRVAVLLDAFVGDNDEELRQRVKRLLLLVVRDGPPTLIGPSGVVVRDGPAGVAPPTKIHEVELGVLLTRFAKASFPEPEARVWAALLLDAENVSC